MANNVYTYTFPNHNSEAKRKRIIFAAVFTLVLVLGILICLTIALSAKELQQRQSNIHRDFDTDGSPLDYFNTSNDAILITWYHGANSQAKITEAIDGAYMMIEGDINLRWYGYPNQTDEPIMAHPPDVDSDLTLDQWIEQIMTRDDKGMKLDFKSDDVVSPSLEILAGKGSDVSLPVWVNADIVRGPGSPVAQPIDPDRFLDSVNDLYPEVTLSLGWKTGCCRWNYTRDHMTEMWNIVQDVTQSVTFPARAALLRNSWEEFRWLVNKQPERFTITVWTPSGRDEWEGASEWDMLYCRNDMHKSMIYFDLPGEKFEEFQSLAITAGTPLNHFDDIDDMDGIHVTWAHAVNSQAKLTVALQSEVMMLEADVILRGQGTDNQTDTPVMAHPPDTDSDITLQQWLERVLDTQKGIKLDFKSIDALEPSLIILLEQRVDIVQPVFINADILEGPGGTATPVDSTQFKTLVNQYFPWTTLSVGWTTGWSNNPDTDPIYNETMVTEMMSYVQDLNQPITFPLRAAMVKESWDVLYPLLEMSRGHTFTIWSAADDEVNVDDLVFVRENSDTSKVFYDLPNELMDEFLERINPSPV